MGDQSNHHNQLNKELSGKFKKQDRNQKKEKKEKVSEQKQLLDISNRNNHKDPN